MNKPEAHSLLNAAKHGLPVDAADITLALWLTGDLGSDVQGGDDCACYGVACDVHPACARYHAIETDPEAERIGRCEGKSLYIPINQLKGQA